MTFDDILPVILKYEGGYVNDKDDSGGATNKGVTQETYNIFRRKWQLSLQDVRYITDTEVHKIYESFWKDAKCDRIVVSHPRTAGVHFDFAINAGTKRANKTLQRAIGGILVDGLIGNLTLSALNLSDDLSLMREYTLLRKDFYTDLAIRRPKDRKFLKGWLWRANDIAKKLLAGTENN